MKVYRATVTLASGEVVKVKYPADSPVPNQAAVEAAREVLGKSASEKLARAPRIEHHRDGEPEELPSSHGTT